MKIDVILKLNMTAARFECFAVDHGVDNIAAAVAEFDGFIGKAQVIERYVGGKGDHKQDTGVRLCQKRKSKIFRQLFAKLFCCGMSECRAAILRHRL